MSREVLVRREAMSATQVGRWYLMMETSIDASTDSDGMQSQSFPIVFGLLRLHSPVCLKLQSSLCEAQPEIIRHRDTPEMGKTAMPWYDNAVYNPPGSELLGHSGGTHGFSAFIGFDKTKRRGVVVLSNQRTLSAGGIGWAILQEMPLSRENGRRLVREQVGIGTGFGTDEDTGNILISIVFPSSPDGRAGLEVGQVIRRINGVSVAGKSPVECFSLMPGPVGTKVRLELFDPKRNESKTVELTKQKFLTVTG